MSDYSHLSDEELLAAIGGQSPQAPDYSHLSDAELMAQVNGAEPTPKEGPGLLSRALETYESYLPGPARAGLKAIPEGHNPVAAWWEQLGKPSNTAPTGEQVAAAYGASQKPLYSGQQMNPEDTGFTGQDLNDMYAAQNILKLSPAEIAGTGINLTADPLIAAGPMIRGGAKGLEFARGLGQVGAVGSEIPKAATLAEEAAAASKATASVPKVNEAEIKAAAESLGVPTFKGQLSADAFSQKLEQLLQQSNSLVGRNRQRNLGKALESIGAQTQELVPASDLSKLDVGTEAQSRILEQIAAEKKPISGLYETLKESTQNIPVSERSLKAVSRNVQKLPEGQFRGPGKSFIETQALNINDIKTVDDVKRLRTQLRGMLQGGASDGERSAAAKIMNKLKALEEGTVVRQAKQLAAETKDPRVGELVKSLINDRKSADSQYKEFIAKVSDLAEGLGKKRIKSPGDAERFISGLKEEQVVDRLFQKNGSSFMQSFQKNYPEVAEKIYAFQKARIATLANKTGKFNPKVVVKEVSDLPREVQELMFTKEELAKIKNVGTYLKNLPPQGNPSGTSVMQDLMEMLSSPRKAILHNARDFAALKQLESGTSLGETALNSARNAGAKAFRGAGRAAGKAKYISPVRAARLKALEE